MNLFRLPKPNKPHPRFLRLFLPPVFLRFRDAVVMVVVGMEVVGAEVDAPSLANTDTVLAVSTVGFGTLRTFRITWGTRII